MTKLLLKTRTTTLLLILLAGLSACGQKGPLIVDQTDPFATEPLQETSDEIGPQEQE